MTAWMIGALVFLGVASAGIVAVQASDRFMQRYQESFVNQARVNLADMFMFMDTGTLFALNIGLLVLVPLLLWALSGNQLLRTLLRQVTAPLFAMGVIVRSSTAIRTLGESQAAPADHRWLIDAICGGTVDQAVEAMRAHVTQNWQRIKEYLATYEKVEVIDRPRSTAPSRARRKPS